MLNRISLFSFYCFKLHNHKHSIVAIRDCKESKRIKISSDLKPEILDAAIKKWQTLLDTLAKGFNVSSGLILRLNEEIIELFFKRRTWLET